MNDDKGAVGEADPGGDSAEGGQHKVRQEGGGGEAQREEGRTAAEGACWEWPGSRGKNGYATKGAKYVHRLMWEMANGPIPDGLCVLHRCDNRPCVNPAHLWLGTKKQNTADMMAKGRHRTARLSPEGELRRLAGLRDWFRRNPIDPRRKAVGKAARIPSETVAKIKGTPRSTPTKVVASDHGVSKTTVRRIWKKS